MIKVYKNIYVGMEKVRHLLDKNEYSFLGVSSKFHYELMGWQRGFRYQDDPNYIAYMDQHLLSLNWVDAEARFYDWQGQGLFYFTMALNFIENQLSEGRKVFIFCDKGQSRSPSVALLYLSKRLKVISNESFDKARQDFLLRYPMYSPGGIKDFISEHWEEIK